VAEWGLVHVNAIALRFSISWPDFGSVKLFFLDFSLDFSFYSPLPHLSASLSLSLSLDKHKLLRLAYKLDVSTADCSM
jgi:hypothetical protein